MNKKYPLDASAILALLQEEKGSEMVAQRIPLSAISTVNLAEVASVLNKIGMPENEIGGLFNELDLDILPYEFGANGSYLIDFFHLCDYLSEAAPKNEACEGAWYKEQKALLKMGQVEQVIDALKTRIEPGNEEGPVYKCYRYMTNRKQQLFYKEALKKKLPIGSGEIESAHRYVVQHRFKLAGTWWKSDNIDYMLSLQLNRANRCWDDYWDLLAKIAA